MARRPYLNDEDVKRIRRAHPDPKPESESSRRSTPASSQRDTTRGVTLAVNLSLRSISALRR